MRFWKFHVDWALQKGGQGLDVLGDRLSVPDADPEHQQYESAAS
jgi:hypothetical protein